MAPPRIDTLIGKKLSVLEELTQGDTRKPLTQSSSLYGSAPRRAVTLVTVI